MTEQMKLIVFTLDNQRYGLTLSCIYKVLRSVEVTPIAKASDFILGIINLHGEIVPVLNIRKLLGLTDKRIDLDDRFILIEMESHVIIFVVDSVLLVSKFDLSELSSIECNLPANSEYIKGIWNQDGDLAFVLDIEKLLSRDQYQVIQTLSTDRSDIT